MGEEVRITDYNAVAVAGDEDDDDRVSEWEIGLPSSDDLTPLSQQLVPEELASAFSISPEPRRSLLEVNRASQSTLSNLRVQSQAFNFKSFNSDDNQDQDLMETEDTDLTTKDGSELKKFRKQDRNDLNLEEADSSAMGNCTAEDNQSGGARTVKRPRLVWTPQLHKRFVDVVAHLGIKSAVPKTIMQLMNVEGLTRENVASHLQKYRLYLKRMQGVDNDGVSSSDHLFASTPVPPCLNESGGASGREQNKNRNNINNSNDDDNNCNTNGCRGMGIAMPYGAQMVPMMGMGQYGPGGYASVQYNPYSMVPSYQHHVTPREDK